MRKLIEVTEESTVVCDNPNCDFEIPYDPENKIQLLSFINVPCPKCGENLLTVDDYLRHEQLMKTVRFINRWFGWLAIFYSKKNRAIASVITHEKVTIEIKNNQ